MMMIDDSKSAFFLKLCCSNFTEFESKQSILFNRTKNLSFFFVFSIQMLYRNKITGYAITILTLRSTKIVLQQSEIFSFENERFFIQVKDEGKKR